MSSAHPPWFRLGRLAVTIALITQAPLSWAQDKASDSAVLDTVTIGRFRNRDFI